MRHQALREVGAAFWRATHGRGAGPDRETRAARSRVDGEHRSARLHTHSLHGRQVGELPADRERSPLMRPTRCELPSITGSATHRARAVANRNDPATLRYHRPRGINRDSGTDHHRRHAGAGLGVESTAVTVDGGRPRHLRSSRHGAIGVGAPKSIQGLEPSRFVIHDGGHPGACSTRSCVRSSQNPLEPRKLPSSCRVDELKIVKTHSARHGDAYCSRRQTRCALPSSVRIVNICSIGGDEFCIVLERGGLIQRKRSRPRSQCRPSENHRSVRAGSPSRARRSRHRANCCAP